MLGWHISIYRQQNDGASPAIWESPEGARLAVWQTGLGGLDWMHELVKTGNAISLGGNGYPFRFTVMAQYVVPKIIADPPGAHPQWLAGAGDVVTDKWAGKTVVDDAAASACRPDEWLLVQVWDES